MKAVTFVLGLLLMLAGCDKGSVNPPGSKNDTDYGNPYKIKIYPVKVANSEKIVSFGLIADTHIDASNAAFDEYCNTPRVERNRTVIDDLNIDAVSAGCLGIVHLGDMTDACHVQNLISFRQHYEDDYPGHNGGAIAGASDDDDDAYCGGHHINKPVFPTFGNHGDCDKVASYIADRVVDAPDLVAHYGKVAYIWRWGQYYFINLGLWAGSYEHESNADIDYDKLRWLEAWLAEHVGDSNLGLLIFQHYGWDGFSKNGDWWSDFMRNLELDVLMRRKLDGNSDEPPGVPYNVLGIFTGHAHDPFAEIRVDAGLDSLTRNKVYFDNFVCRDAGAESFHYGYSIVYLTGDLLKIRTKTIACNEWAMYQKSIQVGW